jgi:hypothetical protein
MSQEHPKDATIQEILDGKNAVRQQLPEYPIWILVAEQPLQKGDYVLATKWHDGDPRDHFYVGFYKESYNGGLRHLIVDENDNLVRGNGFRRVEAITAEEGKAIIALIPKIGDKPGRSLWWHLGCIRGVADPYDPCDHGDEDDNGSDNS